MNFIEDDVIRINLKKGNAKLYKKNCWMINLEDSIEGKMDIEFDHRSYFIDIYYDLNKIKQYFKLSEGLILLYEFDGTLSDQNEDKYSEYSNDITLDRIIEDGNGLFLLKENILYFSTIGNINPITNDKTYSIIIYDIQTNANNVSDDKFTFGLNWLDLVNNRINDEIIESAKEKIDEFFDNGDMLKNKSVIDIGCGSGIHSLNMLRYCKKITSLDIDENCIKATNILKEKYKNKYNYNIDDWDVKHLSILDKKEVNKLGKFDVVYSWGVLHHTGNMWEAIENSCNLCKKGGIFLISLYSAYLVYFKTLLYKLKFNKSNKYQKIKMIADRVMTVKHRNKKSDNWNVLTRRGMNVFNDIVDWLGGYPYEVATTEIICKFMEEKGFTLLKKQDAKNRACHEWLFLKN